MLYQRNIRLVRLESHGPSVKSILFPISVTRVTFYYLALLPTGTAYLHWTSAWFRGIQQDFDDGFRSGSCRDTPHYVRNSEPFQLSRVGSWKGKGYNIRWSGGQRKRSRIFGGEMEHHVITDGSCPDSVSFKNEKTICLMCVAHFKFIWIHSFDEVEINTELRSLSNKLGAEGAFMRANQAMGLRSRPSCLFPLQNGHHGQSCSSCRGWREN